jgi:5'-3' exonuclease
MGKTPIYQNVESIKELLLTDDVQRKFANRPLAVDASMWMHQALTSKYTVDSHEMLYQYVVHHNCDRAVRAYVEKAVCAGQFGLQIIHVFDGDTNPFKKTEEDQRANKRAKHIAQVERLVKEGVGMEGIDANLLKKAVSRTNQFQTQLVKALQDGGFQVIVAPQEADPQLAYLCVRSDNPCVGVIADDSDVLVRTPSNTYTPTTQHPHHHTTPPHTTPRTVIRRQSYIVLPVRRPRGGVCRCWGQLGC